jgi:hypothetical protein
MIKQKPTKVTKEDIELAEELSRITTIKSLLDNFGETVGSIFSELTITAEQSNPVVTYLNVLNAHDAIQTSLQLVQVELLHILGEIGEEDAHVLAAEVTTEEVAVEAEPGEIDEALTNFSEKE